MPSAICKTDTLGGESSLPRKTEPPTGPQILASRCEDSLVLSHGHSAAHGATERAENTVPKVLCGSARNPVQAARIEPAGERERVRKSSI